MTVTQIALFWLLGPSLRATLEGKEAVSGTQRGKKMQARVPSDNSFCFHGNADDGTLCTIMGRLILFSHFQGTQASTTDIFSHSSPNFFSVVEFRVNRKESIPDCPRKLRCAVFITCLQTGVIFFSDGVVPDFRKIQGVVTHVHYYCQWHALAYETFPG